MQLVIQYIEKNLNGLYPVEEIRAFARLVLEHVCGLNYTQFLICRDKRINTSEREQIRQIVERLKKFEPLQYILGETCFYGLRLKVNPSVLIPRPETEELVQWVLNTNRLISPTILDIGTGSGCIALALKKALPLSRVAGTDISDGALITARENATGNQLDVGFFKSNILKWESQEWEMFDLIVSNPPYVREQEKKDMLPNVLWHEPGTALFVPDSDPLIFYHKIGEFAMKYLKNDGCLFFEINENLGDEMEGLLSGLGFSGIRLNKDLRGKNRMLRCHR